MLWVTCAIHCSCLIYSLLVFTTNWYVVLTPDCLFSLQVKHKPWLPWVYSWIRHRREHVYIQMYCTYILSVMIWTTHWQLQFKNLRHIFKRQLSFSAPSFGSFSFKVSKCGHKAISKKLFPQKKLNFRLILNQLKKIAKRVIKVINKKQWKIEFFHYSYCLFKFLAASPSHNRP
jgi:hypothetical protein